MTEVKHTHEGVEITYNLDKDSWEFELRGRSRSAASLRKAMEAIDKAPAEKRKPFKRFEAIFLCGYDEPRIVEVTSFAGYGYQNTAQWWISDTVQKHFAGVKLAPTKERKKADGDKLFLVTKENDKIIQEAQELDKQVDILRDKRRKLLESLAKIPAPTKDMQEE